MKKLLVLALAACGMAFAATPNLIEGKQESRFMSRAVGPNDGYDLQVSTILRSHTADNRYMPLVFMIHNENAPNVHVTPGNFVLKTADGQSVAPVPADVFMKDYARQASRDRRFLAGRKDVGFQTVRRTWRPEGSRFYPLPSLQQGGLNDDITLRPRFFMIDWLYFPQQPAGNYTLEFTADSGETLSVPVTLL